MAFFSPKTLWSSLDSILHTNTFPTVQESPQLELICESYASHKLAYLVDHPSTSGFHVILH